MNRDESGSPLTCGGQSLNQGIAEGGDTVDSNAAFPNRSGLGLPWFSTKGQIADLALKTLLAVLAGKTAWPEMKQNEFLSAGALLFYGLILAVLVSLGIVLNAIRKARHSRAQVIADGASGTGRESSEQGPVSNLEYARLADAKQQLLCLSHFERFALWQLILKGGLTGEQFADIAQAYGIPVATLFGQKELGKTFAIVQEKSALLVCDETSGGWTIKPEFKDPVHYLIERMSPTFGI
jgi:hypothetical protein